MATHDYVIANGSGSAVRQDINGAFAAIATNNADTTPGPTTTYQYQWWADKTSGLMKLRNGDNDAWVSLFNLDGSSLGPGKVTFGATEVVFNDAGDDVDFRIEGDTEANLFFVDASTDRVGIGTATPGAALEVAQTTDMAVIAGTSGTNNSARLEARSGDGTTSGKYAYIRFNNSDTNNQRYDIGTYGTNDLTFRDVKAASNRMTLDTSGRLVVGTNTARSNFFNGSTVSGLLQVEGTSNLTRVFSQIHNTNNNNGPIHVFGKSRGTTAGSNTLVQSEDVLGEISFQGSDGTELVAGASIAAIVDATPGADDMPGRLAFYTTADGGISPTERMRISRDGSFFAYGVYAGYGAASPNVVVDAGGQLFRSISSGKYKTDVETIENNYSDALLNCRPVWYRSTCETDNPNYGWWGFIAEEVAEIDPRLVHWKTVEVTYDENGSAVETPCDPEPEGVAYDRFVPHLLNLIKRQKEQIEAMEARLSALEAQ